jgi:hypothetical protein
VRCHHYDGLEIAGIVVAWALLTVGCILKRPWKCCRRIRNRRKITEQTGRTMDSCEDECNFACDLSSDDDWKDDQCNYNQCNPALSSEDDDGKDPPMLSRRFTSFVSVLRFMSEVEWPLYVIDEGK